jgi:DNA-binding NarL/FixJ family response regulator
MTIPLLTEEQKQAATKLLDIELNANNNLTARQTQILMLMAKGLSSIEIAEELNRAVSTITNTLSRVYEKIGVSGRVEATLWAVREGLVELGVGDE